jgi:ABC-type transporter Mla subunit MlaD
MTTELRETLRSARGSLCEASPAAAGLNMKDAVDGFAKETGQMVGVLIQLNASLQGAADAELEQLQKLIDVIKTKLNQAADGDTTSESFAAVLKGIPQLAGRERKSVQRFVEGLTALGKRRSISAGSGTIGEIDSKEFAKQLTGGR